jgi:hypothetical protein
MLKVVVKMWTKPPQNIDPVAFDANHGRLYYFIHVTLTQLSNCWRQFRGRHGDKTHNYENLLHHLKNIPVYIHILESFH